MSVVAKFGGSSLADSCCFLNVAKIVSENPERKFIVVSAPGARYPGDAKVTDLLIAFHEAVSKPLAKAEIEARRKLILERFTEIIEGLGLRESKYTLEILRTIGGDGILGERDFIISRGEYLSGIILAELLGFRFKDPADFLLLSENGKYCERERSGEETASNLLREISPVVIPGFYGRTEAGAIKTFSRGGSDITGSVIAAMVTADLYENWTDVSGLMAADPRVVEHPEEIRFISFRELRELTYMGWSVFHDEAVLPVRRLGIPINIKNSNNRSHPGTLITKTSHKKEGEITGIAARKGFVVITVEKSGMNNDIGFAEQILLICKEEEISFEHMPSGIDALSIIVDGKNISGTDLLCARIQSAVDPDSILPESGISLIAVVGEGMAFTPGVAAKVLTALASRNINVRLIIQGASEISIILGVLDEDCDRAVRAIYTDCVT